MIKALIFDCFGVIYGASFEIVQSMVPDGREQELEDLRHAHDHGFITRDEFITEIARLTSKDPREVLDLMNARHILNQQLVELIISLRGQYKVGMLTNVGTNWIDELFSSELKAKLFDEVVESYAVGMMKPQPEIYELMASKLGVLSEECCMIDDAQHNIVGAENAGMKGILFSSSQDLVDKLRAIGVTRDA